MSLEDKLKILAAMLGVLGLFFSGYQIYRSASTDRAKLVYEIQRDGRAVLERASEIEQFNRCILGHEECSAFDIERGRNGIRLVLQFYSSVLNQKRLDALRESEWSIWKDEMCNTLKIPQFSAYWKKYSEKYGAPFRTEISTCAE